MGRSDVGWETSGQRIEEPWLEGRLDSVIDSLICRGERGGAPGLCRAAPQSCEARQGTEWIGGRNAPSPQMRWGHGGQQEGFRSGGH